MSKINILVPVARYIEPQTESCLRELEMKGLPVRRLYGFAAVDQARNVILADAARTLTWLQQLTPIQYRAENAPARHDFLDDGEGLQNG